jgi:S-adenosylmethionine hydrolase
MTSHIITLTTDFGLKDAYVAEMKAVILGICANTTIVDITHKIEKFNIRMGAYVLASASQYFPKGTINLTVVDPGVGTQRQPILIQTKHGYFVGPDNGVLALAVNSQGIEHVYKITNRKLMVPKVSSTFHGRDIFAPAAAHLANETLPKEFGPEIHKIVIPKFAKIVRRKHMLIGEVMHVDGFGNIITNFGEKEVEFTKIKHIANVKLKNTRLKMKFCKTYSDVKPQNPLTLIGSHNFLEISINQGNAAEAFKIKSGDKITLYRSCSNLEAC